MSELYFKKFPTMSYANTICTDITKRVTVVAPIRYSPTLYENYTIKSESRADMIASNYYDDPYYEWLLYLTNGIIDPYYDWNLSSSDLYSHIVQKYGSLETATKKVKYYQNNWANDDTEITPSFYNNSLTYDHKKYYTPNYGQSYQIISYRRKQDDTTKNTNKLIDMSITINTGNGYIVGETVDILNVNTAVGAGEIEFANTTNVKIKNISGNTSATNSIRGDISNTKATITTSSVLFENITNDEAVYWSPVYYYDYEVELNEKNKNIKLLNQNYALQVAEQLRKVLKS